MFPAQHPPPHRQSAPSAARAPGAKAAGRDEVVHLGLAQGQAIVVIERLALGYDHEPIEWRRSRGAASTFRYHVEVR